jgi:hypothetical protein
MRDAAYQTRGPHRRMVRTAPYRPRGNSHAPERLVSAASRRHELPPSLLDSSRHEALFVGEVERPIDVTERFHRDDCGGQQPLDHELVPGPV